MEAPYFPEQEGEQLDRNGNLNWNVFFLPLKKGGGQPHLSAGIQVYPPGSQGAPAVLPSLRLSFLTNKMGMFKPAWKACFKTGIR